jgi:spore coat protein CotH
VKKLILSIAISCLFSASTIAQNFYDRSTVQTIEIFFGFSNWDTQLDAATSTDSYIIADSIRINGVVFDSVGVKYKGNSSYNQNSAKNPLHISLDEFKDHFKNGTIPFDIPFVPLIILFFPLILLICNPIPPAYFDINAQFCQVIEISCRSSLVPNKKQLDNCI